MTKELRRARRSAIRAKTSMPCVSCLAYGHRCSQVRPCSRCIKLSKECLRPAFQHSMDYAVQTTVGLLLPANTGSMQQQYGNVTASISSQDFKLLCEMRHPLQEQMDPHKNYSSSHSSEDLMSIEYTASASLEAYGFSIGQIATSSASAAGKLQATSAEIEANSSAERISVMSLVHADNIIDGFRH